MEKFKDFLYNKNDIIVALIILIVAAGIIFFRVQAIMEYPSTISKEIDSNKTTTTINDKDNL